MKKVYFQCEKRQNIKFEHSHKYFHESFSRIWTEWFIISVIQVNALSRRCGFIKIVILVQQIVLIGVECMLLIGILLNI